MRFVKAFFYILGIIFCLWLMAIPVLFVVSIFKSVWSGEYAGGILYMFLFGLLFLYTGFVLGRKLVYKLLMLFNKTVAYQPSDIEKMTDGVVVEHGKEMASFLLKSKFKDSSSDNKKSLPNIMFVIAGSILFALLAFAVIFFL